ADADGGGLRGDCEPWPLVATSSRRPRGRGWTAFASPAAPRVRTYRGRADGDAEGRRGRRDGPVRGDARLSGRRQDRDGAEAGLARRVRDRTLRRFFRRDRPRVSPSAGGGAYG